VPSNFALAHPVCPTRTLSNSSGQRAWGGNGSALGQQGCTGVQVSLAVIAFLIFLLDVLLFCRNGGNSGST